MFTSKQMYYKVRTYLIKSENMYNKVRNLYNQCFCVPRLIYLKTIFGYQCSSVLFSLIPATIGLSHNRWHMGKQLSCNWMHQTVPGLPTAAWGCWFILVQ